MKAPRTPEDVDWSALLRNAKVVDLDALRKMKEAHRRLFTFNGPPAIASFVRLFRLVNLFGFFAMRDKRFPVLNRAWADLQWIARHPEVSEFAVAGWVLLDLPVTEEGRTVAELFVEEIAPDNADARAFAEITRKSRYGVYEDVGGTRQSHRLQELVTRRKVTVTRGVGGDPGELYWTRIIEWGGMAFMLGDTRGWPADRRRQVEEMIIDRVGLSPWMTAKTSVADAYEPFMKMTGPYWFSVLYAHSDDDPVLEPDHYLSYRSGPVPDLLDPRRW